MTLIKKDCRGITGHLLTFGDKEYFRVYDKDYNFIDYEILHNDLLVTIKDFDSAFYENNGEYYLDHSPETLGDAK